MQLAYALLASYAEPSGDGRLNIIGADLEAIQLQLHELPYTHPLIYLIAKVNFSPEEAGKPVEYVAEFVDAENHEIAPAARNRFTPTSIGPEAIPSMAILVGFQQPTFPALGRYQVRLIVGGELVKELPLRVRASGPAELLGNGVDPS